MKSQEESLHKIGFSSGLNPLLIVFLFIIFFEVFTIGQWQNQKTTKNTPTKKVLSPKNDDSKQKFLRSWRRKSDNGQLLKLLIGHGMVHNMSANDIINNYPQFQKFQYKALTSVLRSTLR